MPCDRLLMSDARPSLGGDVDPAPARAAVERFVAGLQAGLDRSDADVYDGDFAQNLLWGSPYGLTLAGYDDLNAIHHFLMADAAAPPSQFETVQVLTPAPGIAIAHIRRQALPADGTDGFSEMALYVLVEHQGKWWLAAGQNTPITPRET